MSRYVLASALSALLPLLAGCSSADDPTDPNDQSETTDETPEPGGPAGNGPDPCGVDSNFDGDEVCILPPEEGTGFQLHVGPTDYDDPDDVARFLMPPDKESVDCWFQKTPNDHDVYQRQSQYRMRPGTHHLILKNGEPSEDGWGACPDFLSGAIGGSQNSITDRGYKDIAPEDEGYASVIPANHQVGAELHYFNATEGSILREVWVNFYEADPSTVTGTWKSIALVGANGLVIPAKEEKTIRYGVENDLEGRRLATVVGHVHAHTVRFSAWKVGADSSEELIYELYDWAEPLGMSFNSITTNPRPDEATLTEGGHSGILTLAAGDRIEWECEVHNDLEIDLVFNNEALTAEMCILFGSTPQPTWFALPGPM
jgi:hypothetical protein